MPFKSVALCFHSTCTLSRFLILSCKILPFIAGRKQTFNFPVLFFPRWKSMLSTFSSFQCLLLYFWWLFLLLTTSVHAWQSANNLLYSQLVGHLFELLPHHPYHPCISNTTPFTPMYKGITTPSLAQPTFYQAAIILVVNFQIINR